MAMKKGSYHMADNPALYEPQRSNCFELVVTGIDNLLRSNHNGDEENAYITGAQEVLRIAVNKSAIPMFSQANIDVRTGNSVVNFAGVPSFDAGSFTVVDWIGAETKDILMAWQALSYNVATQRVGLASEYKKLCYLIEYDPKGNEVRTWTMKGLYISGLSEDGFDDEAGGKMQITAKFVYDSAFMNPSDEV